RRRPDQVPRRGRSADVGAEGPAHPLPDLPREARPPRGGARTARRRRDRRGGAPLRGRAARRSAHDVRSRLRHAAARPGGAAGRDGRARARRPGARRPAAAGPGGRNADAGPAADTALTMAKLNMVKALNLALLEEMERDNDVLVLGEDVGVEDRKSTRLNS